MSIGGDSVSNSQYLSSSQSSLHHSKKSSSEISKTYKHASQLYLTRRLAEAYESLQPVIRPPIHASNGHQNDEDSKPLAAIATAGPSHRIKIWSLYITLLNAIVELGLEDGKRDFGQKEYKSIVSNVRDGDVWEQVVEDGYNGREGSVDAEVVYNLSTLLLGQAPDQKLNQSRLETYLSSSSQPDLDISGQFSKSPSIRSNNRMNGTDTPRDLTARLKILELFTLHILPRNEEWDYAQSFITNSDIIDDERREAFLHTLQELQEFKDHDSYQEDVFEETNESFDATTDHQPSKPYDENLATNGIRHKRTSSEVDYGIEATPLPTKSTTSLNGGSSTIPNVPANPNPPSAKPTPTPPTATPRSAQSHLSPPAQTPRNRAVRKPSPKSKSNDLIVQARNLMRSLQNLVRKLAGAVTSNPTALLRTMLFVLAIIIAFSRRAVRERAMRITGQGWQKMKGTVGMGVKVSYI